ncbi:transposase [Asaia bogorensis NBRC 16594]|nr:transposase [Asaia bogorensis NBRC 16594]
MAVRQVPFDGVSWPRRLATQQQSHAVGIGCHTGSKHRPTGIVAPMVLDGPVNGRGFQAYVERALVPDLHPGDIVVMDNLGSHKGPGEQVAIEALRVSPRFLPPYSPDFNPIEMALPKLKAYLHRTTERTRDGLWDGIGKLIDQVARAECAIFLIAAGYESD